MGTLKSMGQLYGSPTALTSQYLARDHYCTYVFQTPRMERPVFDVNTKFASEFTFGCV